MTSTTRHDILTAAPTAFAANGDLDLAGTHAILRNIAASGVQGALVLGTTGEFPSLSREERKAIAEISVEALAGLRLVVHVGASSLHEVAELIADAREVGATAIAVLTPYYLPASPGAVLEFFRAVSAISDGLEVYVYLFTARTGIVVDPEELAVIAELPNIVGAKLSGESLDRVSAFRAAVADEFELFTGADIDLARAADHGAQGVISGIASVFPKPFIQLQKALYTGDSTAITAAQPAIDDVVSTVAGDPARMKFALRLQGIPAGYARMALDVPEGAVVADLKRAVKRYA
jgi:4-hydroxy-tetrahydrodipicolinate synthase